MTRYMGIDPGSTTGAVLIECTPAAGTITEPSACTLIAAEQVRASEGKYLSHAQSDVTLFFKLAELVRSWAPNVIVIEEPADIGTAWRGGGKQGRTTAFALGKIYGLALGAANEGQTVWKVVSYLCKGFDDKPARQITRGDGKKVMHRAHKPREGWMPRQGTAGRKGNSVMSHDDQLHLHGLRVAQMRDARNETKPLTEHCIFAAAVVLYHLHKPNTDPQ